MSAISHKQAIRLIHRRLDGFLDSRRFLSLDGHLRSCESCRAYAARMELIPPRLHHEFHARWDQQPGPSHRVLEQVMAKAKRIPMTNRFSSWFRLLASAAALLLLAIVMNYIVPVIQNGTGSRTAGTPTSPALRIDPQSCKAASELNSALRPPNKLFGYQLVQGTSFISGDFSYEFWLYCDPSLKPNNPNQYSAIAGLGIYAVWRYTGPRVEGANQYYFEFESNAPLGMTSWNGPFYKSSGGGNFGITLAEQTLRERAEYGLPIQFHIIVDSDLGQNGSTFSFHLERTEHGYEVANLQAGKFNHLENGLIAFTSAQNGTFDIYTMRTDGSKLINLTNNPSNDLSPLWSPDGKKIAFTSERTGNTDIFVMNSDGSDLTQLTENSGYDGFFSWSPDGQKIVYLSSAINYPYVAKLMVMNADGSNQTALTQETGSYDLLGWSPDGRKIVYQNIKERGIYAVSIGHQNQQNWPVNNDQVHWQDSEYFLSSSWNGVSEQPQWVLQRFNINGDLPLQPVEVASHTSPIVAIFGATYIVEGGTTLAWYSTEKNAIPLATWNLKKKCINPGDPFLQETAHRISPDGAHAFVMVSCFEGPTWFYSENADGSEVKQLTDFSVARSSQILDRAWSPDGKYVVLTIAESGGDKTDIYLFDIEKMLRDPLTQPVRLTTDEATKYGAIWQPIP